MSFQNMYASKAIGITDLKRASTLLDEIIEPVAILKRDSVKCYLVPESFMEKFQELMDEISLTKLVNKRIDEELETAREILIDDL